VVVKVVVVVKVFLIPTKKNSVVPRYTAVPAPATRQTCLPPHRVQLMVCGLSVLHLHIGSKEIFGRERPLTNAHHHIFAFCQTSSFSSSHLAIPITHIFVVINMCQTLSTTSDVRKLIQYKNWRQMQKQTERRKPPMLSSVPSILLPYLISACV